MRLVCATPGTAGTCHLHPLASHLPLAAPLSSKNASSSESPTCLWKPSLSSPPPPHGAPFALKLEHQGSVGPLPGGSRRSSARDVGTRGLRRAHNVTTRAQAPDTGVQRKANAMHTLGPEGKKNFLKASSPQKSASPSGYHRCLVTAEICLPEAGTGEYFWPN